MMQNETPTLLSPGFVPLHDRVRSACSWQVINPRGSTFSRLYRSIEHVLQQFLGTSNDVLLTSGSGTQAMELAAANTITAGDAVLVVSQGTFGDRFATILSSTIGASVRVFRPPMDEPISRRQLAAELRAFPGVRAVVLVHIETSTGLCNDLASLATCIRTVAPEALMIVDAMSSLAAHELCCDEWGLDVVVSAGHKVCGAPSGLGFVSLSDRAWHACDHVPRRPFVGHFPEMREYHRRGHSQFVLPQHALVGLATALHMIEEMGIDRFRERLATHARLTRDALLAAGLRPVVRDAWGARSVTCAWTPPHVSAVTLVEKLRDFYDVEIGTGRGSFEDCMIRIGHMGTAVTQNSLLRALNAIQECLIESDGKPSLRSTFHLSSQTA